MRILGHPLHPAVVHFPVSCWVLPVFCDAAFYLTKDYFWEKAATWLLGAGLAFAGIAVLAGISDLRQLKSKPEAEVTVSIHAVLMLAAFGFVTASFWGRIQVESVALGWPHLVSVTAAAFVLAGAYYGGELVYKYGFGRQEYQTKNEE